jgi:olefin beta-lactone synthetase
MNVTELLRHHAQSHPDEVALIDDHQGRHRELTFGQLEHAAGQLAALLREQGLKPGDSVLVFHPMSAELYVAIAALLRLGLVAMFIDPSAGKRYIDRCCALHRPRALVAASRVHWLCWLSAELRRIPMKFSIGGRVPGVIPVERARRLSYSAHVQPCTAGTPALVSFTTGSGGEPKAALRTHGFLLAQHEAIAENLALRPGDVELVTLPIFVLANLASRVTSIIPAGDIRRPEAIAAAPIVQQLRGFAANRLAAPPAFCERLVDYCEQQRVVLPGLQRVLTGGGPVSPRLLGRLSQVAGNADVCVVYGATEAEPISTVSLDRMAASDHEAMARGRGLLAGYPVSGLELRILRDQWGRRIGPYRRDEFEHLCEPALRAGEIVVSGRHVLPGYLYGRGNDAHKFTVDGESWHRTGDAGYLDSSGRLWLVGRCAARVEDGRGALYPLGVEHAALQYDYVHRAAFLSHGGRRTLAVELAGSSTNPDLASLLKSLSFAGVEAIRLINKIPTDKRHNAKIDYEQLRHLLETTP